MRETKIIRVSDSTYEELLTRQLDWSQKERRRLSFDDVLKMLLKGKK